MCTSILELTEKFPDEVAAETWCEDTRWPDERFCGHCGSFNTYEVRGRKPQPYRCRDCKRYFSVRTGTPMECTNLPLRTWVFALYLFAGHPKGVSSMQLARDLGVTQKTAWFLLHRLREAWDQEAVLFWGEVEVDETYIGGRFKNMHVDKRNEARETPGRKKSIVAGVRERYTGKVKAEVIPHTGHEVLHRFVDEHVSRDAFVSTDDHAGYNHLPHKKHGRVNHSRGQYANDGACTNGIESFWSIIKRAHKGTYHRLTSKHLQRYVDEFCWRHNHRDRSLFDRMRYTVECMTGKRLMYRELIAV